MRSWLFGMAGLLVALFFVHLAQNVYVYRTLRRIDALGGNVRSYDGSPLAGVRTPSLIRRWYVLRSGYRVTFGDSPRYHGECGSGRSLFFGAYPTRDGGAAGLASAARLPHIIGLRLAGTSVGDEALRHLRGLHELAELDLSSTQVRGPGLRHVRGLPALTKLFLAHAPLRGAALRHLGAPRHLRELDLSGTCIDGEQLAHLAELPALRILDLSHSCIQDHHLRYLRGARLTHLALSHTSISNAAVAHLEAIPSLERVDVDHTTLTDHAARQSDHPAVQDIPRVRRLRSRLDGLSEP